MLNRLIIALKANYGAKRGQVIAGRLVRGNDGKFSSGGTAAVSKPVPKGRKPAASKKPVKTEEQRTAEREARQVAAAQERIQKQQAALAAQLAERDRILSAVGLDASLSGALVDARAGNTISPANGERLAKMGLATKQTDGTYHLNAAGREVVNAAMRGDAGLAGDTLSKAQSDAATVAAKPKGGGGGGKKKEPPVKLAPLKTTTPPKATGGGGGKGGASRPAAPIVSNVDPVLVALAQRVSNGEALDDTEAQALIRNGLARNTSNGLVLTGAGARAIRTKAASRWGLLVERVKAKTKEWPRAAVLGSEISGNSANLSYPLSQTHVAQAPSSMGAARGGSIPPSLLVYKDHTGAARWIARTTTAYRDRDREILPIAALDQDSQRMTTTKQYGPLRWWHVGEPNALATDAPWGAGLDLGMCDYSIQVGRTRVESGTFKDATIAARIAATADQYELSPGFFHAADQPDADGVFRHIHTFERSLVPRRHGRASNLFTGLTVAHKEYHMDAAEQTRRFQAAVKELDLTPEQAQQLSAGLLATDKAAQTTTDPATGLPGVAFKSDDAPPPAGLMDTLRLWLNGDKAPVVVTKEAPTAVDPTAALTAQMAELTATLKDALAPVELKAPVTDGAALAEEVDDEVSDEATTLGAMAPAAFLDMLTQALTQAMAGAMGGISDKVATLDNEMKTMGYVRQKDAQAESDRAKQIAALKAQLDELAGDQPAIPATRPSQDPSNILSALKDVNPAEEFAFADIAAHLFGGQRPAQ